MPEGTPFTFLHYGSVAGVRPLLGATNSAADWDLDSDGNATTITAEQEQTLTEGDNKVDSMLIVSSIAAPVSPSATYYWMLQYAANRYAAVAASRLRGEPGSNGKPAEPYQKYIDEADEMMDRYIAITLYPQSTTGPTGPAADPITVYPTWPTNVTWGTPRWMWPYGW